MKHMFDFIEDLPKRPQLLERLFFALLPDDKSAFQLEMLNQQFSCANGIEGARIKSERLHLSLHHVGDHEHVRTKIVYAARQAAKVVSMRPFEVTFRIITSFDGASPIDGRPPNRPLVLLGESEDLFHLHQVLGAAMEKNGLRALAHFTPHMTLSYGPERVPMQGIEPIRFTVNEFVLVHSKRGLAQYDVLDRWVLN